MKDEILSYWDICSRQGMALQRGMFFRPPPSRGVILMSRRKNAPYEDALSDDESELIYEGHDVYKSPGSEPKAVDQPRFDGNSRPTQNGLFADWVDKMNSSGEDHARFKVYEKLRQGIWSDRGIYLLHDYHYQDVGNRKVFKFYLRQAPFDSDQNTDAVDTQIPVSRQIPSWVKQEVFKRDKGRCVICSATDQLHFDHDLPFSKGGTSVTAKNVRILCARHNLQKSANIE